MPSAELPSYFLRVVVLEHDDLLFLSKPDIDRQVQQLLPPPRVEVSPLLLLLDLLLLVSLIVVFQRRRSARRVQHSRRRYVGPATLRTLRRQYIMRCDAHILVRLAFRAELLLGHEISRGQFIGGVARSQFLAQHAGYAVRVLCHVECAAVASHLVAQLLPCFVLHLRPSEVRARGYILLGLAECLSSVDLRGHEIWVRGEYRWAVLGRRGRWRRGGGCGSVGLPHSPSEGLPGRTGRSSSGGRGFP